MLKKIVKILLCIIAAILIAIAGIWLYLGSSVNDIECVDERGLFYAAEYDGNAYSLVNHLPIALVRGGGCSAFNFIDSRGNAVTGRNYDLAHRDDNGGPTGLNFVFTMSPEGKYKSINFADAAWFAYIGVRTGLESGNRDLSILRKPLLSLLPYLTMDGMNEKGLTASILALDTKDGEKPVCQDDPLKDEACVTEIVRYILDSCQDVGEAVSLCREYNMVNILDHDYHIFVTDRKGKAAVIEWRHNEIEVTYQNAVTNFYVSSDDASDCYINGMLKERYDRGNDLDGYMYGYGHGYMRFNILAEGIADLDNTEEAMELLSDVRQEFTSDELTSNTQYSVVYDQENLKCRVCIMGDYDNVFEFGIE